MKYKNFKWKFANSCMIPIGICFSIILVIMILLLIFIGNYSSIPLVILTIVCMFFPSYLVFLLIGDILYHKSKICIKEEGIYQNKRLLKYENIKEIYIGKMGQIYSFQVAPINDGVFVSKRILIYFYSLDEVYHFIVTHNFSYVLTHDYQYNEIATYIKSIINECGEDLHPDYREFFDEQKTTCECCGNKTIFKRLINDVCPVCHWQNDEDKKILYNPNIVSEINGISLIEAIRNYENLGACKEEYKELVRKPFSYESVDSDSEK